MNIKRYYYQTVQGEVIWMDSDADVLPEYVDLMDNVRAMHQGFIKMFRCPITEKKVVRVMGVVK